MTTATKIRRNTDGQQNLIDLRRALAESPHMIHYVSGDWICDHWSDACSGFLRRSMPPWHTERQAIQYAFGLEVESEEEAAMRFAR